MSRDSVEPVAARSVRSLLRDVVLLGTGAASGQAIVMLFSPVLTRLYDVEAFGLFGMFSAVVTSIGTVSTLRYEQAILLEPEDEGAAEVFRLCIAVVLGVTVLSLAGFAVAEMLPIHSTFQRVIPMLLAFGGANIVAQGVFSSLYGWFTRFGSFRALAIFQFSRSAIGIALQLALCLLGHDARFLIVGQVVGMVAAMALILALGRPSVARVMFGGYRLSSLWRLARRYHTFALFGAPQTLVRLLSQNLPALLLPVFFGASQSGLFWLAYRILILPSGIIIDSTRGVLFRDLGAIYRSGGDMRPAIIPPLLSLGAFSLAVVAVLWCFGPFLFGFVFGPQWRESGHYAAILSLAWAVENAGMPASVVISLMELQRFYLAVEILSLVMRSIALYLGTRYGSATIGISLYVAAAIVASLINITYVWWHLARGPKTIR